MRYNFNTASVKTVDESRTIVQAIEDDLRKFWDAGKRAGIGGTTAVNMEMKWRAQAAALIREQVEDRFAMTNPVPIFTRRMGGDLGDKHEFTRIIPTSRVVEYFPGAEPRGFVPRKVKYAITTDFYTLDLSIQLLKIMAGQLTLNDFVDDAAQAMLIHTAELVLTAIDAAVSGQTGPRGEDLSTAAAGADVAKAEIDAVLRRLGPGSTIFGTRFAIDPLFDHGADNDIAKEELRQRGVLSTYRGSRIVALDESKILYEDRYPRVGVTDWEKKLFIAAPGEAGAVWFERDVSQLDFEAFNVREAYWETATRMDHGVLVDKPYQFHVITLM